MKMEFDIYTPYTDTHHHSCGVRGLAIALRMCDRPPAHEITETKILIEWSDLEGQLNGLINTVYRIESGLLCFPWGVDTWHQSKLLSTTLSIPALRKAGGKVLGCLPSLYGNIDFESLGIESTIYHDFAKYIVKGKKKTLQASIEAKSWLIPNSSAGCYVRPEIAIAMLFAPLEWVFCEIRRTDKQGDRHYSIGLLSPVAHAIDWRLDRPREYQDLVFGNLQDAVYFLSAKNGGIDCHGYEYRRDSATRPPRIVQAARLAAGSDYEELLENLPNRGGVDDQDKIFVAPNQVRAIGAKNLAANQPWYKDIDNDLTFDDLKAEGGAIKQILTPQERWKEKTGFESSDHRKGYRSGYNAANRGKLEPPSDLPDNDWGTSYLKGFAAARKKTPE